MKVLHTTRGLTVLFRQMDSSLVDLRYLVRCGAVDENEPSDYGACHALEHMLFQGTSKRTWREINNNWEEVGASSNAHTGYDYTTYEATVLNKYWKTAYEILADMFHNPIIPEDRWEEVEKGAVISEIQGYNDDMPGVFYEQLLKDSLGKNTHPICGSEEGIRNTSVKTLRKFYEKYYCGNNVFLLVTGDLSEDQLLRTIEKYDRLRTNTPPVRSKFDYSFNYRPFRLEADVEQILMSRKKPLRRPSSLRRQMALMTANECLSRYLFEELREVRGLCYSAASDLFWAIPNNLLLDISVGTDAERGLKTQRAIKFVLNNFMEQGLTKERIENTRKKIAFGLSGASEDILESSKAMWGMYEEGIYSDPFKAGLSILAAVNVGEVRKAAREMLDGNFKTAIMAPGE